MLAWIIKKIRIKKWVYEGLKIGKNFQLERNSYIDSSFPWLIEIGDNVTIAPDTLILSHDGSTQKIVGYSKVGRVTIGNNVFIGAKCIVLPGTVIGDNAVIAAGSIVSGTVPDNSIFGGCPAKELTDVETFGSKHMKRMAESHIYEIDYTKRGKVTEEKKALMKKALEHKRGYIV